MAETTPHLTIERIVMATACSTNNLHFGLGFIKSKLPAGWTLEESKNDWARGIDADGKRYFLSETKAYPQLENGSIHTEKGIIEL